MTSSPLREAPTPRIANLVRLMRPKQWIKNFFVLAPALFAREMFHPDMVLVALKAFFGFCLTASAVYIVNDMTDVEADRSHPEKKHRPLAAGTVTSGEAFALLGVLLVLAMLLALTLPATYGLILAAYFLINLAYSYKLKEVILLDVFMIAAGFMLRVLGGAAAISVPVSSWIVLCTLFISLFLGFAKRRSELVTSHDSGSTSERKVLMLYSVGFLDQVLTIVAAGAVISYALYTVAPRTVETFGTENLIYTTIFVLFGIFRYLHLIHTSEATENPTNAVTSDPAILTVVILWVVTCVLIIYRASEIWPILPQS